MSAKYVVTYYNDSIKSLKTIGVNNENDLINLCSLLERLEYVFSVLDNNKNMNVIIMKTNKPKPLFKYQIQLKEYSVTYI